MLVSMSNLKAGCSSLSRRKITVFSANMAAVTFDHGESESTGPDLLVSFHNNEHYNSVRSMDEPNSKPPPQRRKDPKQAKKKSTLLTGKMKLRSNKFDWRDIHFTGENIKNGNLRKHRSKPWNFGHLHHTTQNELEKNPGYDLYMFGSAQPCDDPSVEYQKGSDGGNMAPVTVIIRLPSGAYQFRC